MIKTLLFVYGILIFFYSMSLIVIYVSLLIMAYREQKRNQKWEKSYIKNMVDTSPYSLGVSIVAGAYNEENTIVENVNSLLSQDYPLFEVVIANDGSTDKTLEKMIEAFDLVETPYDYRYKVYCKPFRRLFKSANPKYANLTVVDKENGGTKADAINGGLNVARYPYFINTDADCLLAKDAIYQCIFPVLLNKNVIAVSGTMSMSNGFKVDKDGNIVEYRPSSRLLPLFQDLEYKRSFLIGKMGWSRINSMPNVSGGYGLFNTDVVIAAGGYSYDSFAEDMDMLWRMIQYCCDFSKKYKIVQIPHTCCWTEGPATLKTIHRQRTRWGRGLFQIIHKFFGVFFKKRYRQLGMVTFPYEFSFEFLAPIIETTGFLTLIYLVLTGGVNWQSFWVMFFAIYLFSAMLSFFIILYDYLQGGSYNKISAYLKLILAALLEPILYHPLITFFSIKGYFQYMFNTKAVWGNMQHKGLGQKKK